MQIDLERQEIRSETLRSQVCIVGAGVAGLVLASQLSRQGIDVIVLEAGGEFIDKQSQDYFATAQLTGHPHLGTTEGRFRAMGGSSLRWGGQLLPPPQEADSAWPIDQADLEPFVIEAERLLGVDDLPYASPAFFTAIHANVPPLLTELPEVDACLSKWTPFARRNLAHTLGSELLAHPQVRVFLHAQAMELLLAASRSRVMAVLVRTGDGKILRFEADHFIVATGTVETSRLLLASRSVVASGVGNDCDQVGRNFHDHLTLPAATITGAARTRLLRELRPWIRGTTLHSVKLSPSPQLSSRLALNPILAHLTLEEFEGSGLAVIRELLTALQHGDIRAALSSHAAHLPAAALDALRLGWSAVLQRRRFVSPSTSVKLYLNAAQDTPTRSRITLSEELDPAGVPQAVVDWRITPHELQTLSDFALHLSKRLPSRGIQWLPGVFSPDTPVQGLLLSRIQDARHAMGGACMGTDPRSSVVDPNLTVHGIDNLSIAGAATFPTGSPPLPALPLMALALRLAEHVTARLAALPSIPTL
jgi:choline dehydrogenase-like flavoprotein